MAEPGETREIVDFEGARIDSQFAGGFTLTVWGESRCPRVVLEEAAAIPEREWWPIEVAGYCPEAGGPDVQTEYRVSMPYDELPAFAKGIEVIGRSRSMQLPGAEEPRDE